MLIFSYTDQMRMAARAQSSKLRGNDATRMFTHGLSTEPPILMGFISDTSDPSNQMHNFNLHCKLVDIQKQAFEGGNNVHDGVLVDINYELICFG
jgi:hypothetical protein